MVNIQLTKVLICLLILKLFQALDYECKTHRKMYREEKINQQT